MRTRSRSWLRTLNKCWLGANSQASIVCAGSMATAATAVLPNVEKNHRVQSQDRVCAIH
jgi:hypothetical protein